MGKGGESKGCGSVSARPRGFSSGAGVGSIPAPTRLLVAVGDVMKLSPFFFLSEGVRVHTVTRPTSRDMPPPCSLEQRSNDGQRDTTKATNCSSGWSSNSSESPSRGTDADVKPPRTCSSRRRGYGRVYLSTALGGISQKSGRAGRLPAVARIGPTAALVPPNSLRPLSAGASACTACVAGTFSNETGAGRAVLACVVRCAAWRARLLVHRWAIAAAVTAALGRGLSLHGLHRRDVLQRDGCGPCSAVPDGETDVGHSVMGTWAWRENTWL